MRLIDANALWKKFDEAHLFDDGNPRHIAQQIVEEAPTIDAVPVVRCKECIWGDGDLICVNPKCTKSFYGCPVYPDHFCSYGERKEGDDNG